MKTKLLFLALFLSVNFASAQQLNVDLWLQGFFNAGTGEMSTPLYTCGPNQCSEYLTDYVIISLYDDNCNLAQKEIGLLAKTGEVMVFLGSNMPLTTFTFGNYYWIRVQHRNHIDVWSANPVQINYFTYYNFKTPSGQAYGTGSQVLLPNGEWGMWAGDLDHDCAVTSLDMTLEENASNVGLWGYIVEDLNGDCAADALDMTFIENNALLGVSCQSPCNIDPCFVARRANSEGNTFESSMELSVRPNPSNDNIEVVTNKDQCLLKITNGIGEVVYEERMDYQTNIKVANFPKGIYFLTIERNGNVEGKTKIAVQ